MSEKYMQLLFHFMTSIMDHVLLISHLPTIQDYMDQNIFIEKSDSNHSHVVCDL